MKPIPFIAFLVLFFFIKHIAFAQTPCTNVDFETGDFTGWQGEVGHNLGPSFSLDSAVIVPGRQTITLGTGLDTLTGVPITVVAKGGLYSVRLGNDKTGGEAEKLRQTFRVTPQDTIFMYQYAVVLEDPGHLPDGQPYFQITVLDSGGNIIPCGYYKVVAGQGIPGFQNFSFHGEPLIYKDWDTAFVNLSNYVGQDVTIEFLTADCSYTGHFGYAYVDAICTNNDSIDVILGGMCPGDSLANLTAPAGFFGYLWSTGDTTQTIYITNPVLDSTIYVSLILQQGTACQVTLSEKIKTILPAADFSATTVCTGTATEFTAITFCAPLNWQWDFGDGSAPGNLSNPSHLYAAPGNYNVKVIVTWAGNYTDSMIKTVTVLPDSGNANFGYYTEMCPYDIQFIDSSKGMPIAWNWVFGDGETDTIRNPYYSYYYINPGTYNVTLIVDFYGCSSDTISKQIYLANQFGFNFPDTICKEMEYSFVINFTGDTSSISSIELDWDDGTLIYWDEFSGQWDDTLLAPRHLFSDTGTFYLYFRVNYDDWWCSEEFYDTIQVIEATSQALFGMSNDSICIGNTVSFSDSSTGTIAFWEWNFGDSSPLDATQNPQHTYLTTGIFNVQLRVDTSGCANKISKPIIVFPLPNPIVSTDTTICFGDTAYLNVSGGTSYLWTPNINLSNDTIFNPFVFPTNPIQYKVLVTDINGCQNSDSVNIFIQPLPSANIISPDSQICQGDTISISATSQNGSVSWTEDGKGNISGQGSNSIIYFSDKTDTGKINFIIQVSSPLTACGIEQGTFVLQMKNSPAISLTMNKDTICQNFGEEIHLKASGAATYEWSSIINSDTAFLTSPQDSIIVVPNEPTIYLVKGIDPNNCKNFAQKEITVLSRPIPELNTSSSYDCYPVEVFYQYDLSVSIPLDSVIWDFGNGMLIKNQNPVTHLYEESNTQDYPVKYSAIVKLYYQNGCRAEDTVELIICENFNLPNVFTPDGDGKNDFFVIRGIDDKNCSFMVFNRWGEKIYESADYDNKWDGRDKDGNLLNADTYFYLLGCKEKRWKGWVKIIR